MTKMLARYNEFLKLLCQTDPGIASGASFKFCERAVEIFSTRAYNKCVFFFCQLILSWGQIFLSYAVNTIAEFLQEAQKQCDSLHYVLGELRKSQHSFLLRF